MHCWIGLSAWQTLTPSAIAYETPSNISQFLEEQGTGVNFGQLLKQASERIQDDLKTTNRPSREAYESALARRPQVGDAIARYFEKQRIVALAFPPIMTPPPKIGEESEVEIRGRKISLQEAIGRNIALGSCASMASLILPAGLTSNHLPVGMEFAALNGKDRELLSLGLSLEKALSPIPAPLIK